MQIDTWILKQEKSLFTMLALENALSLKEHPTLPDSYTYREFYEAKKFS